jgi:spermidine synthase
MNDVTPPASPRPSVRILLAVALMAGATLGSQVALTRLFSFLYWHHFAFMIIGIGMLGFGGAGAWLARRGGVQPGPDAHGLAARGAAASSLAVIFYLAVGPYLPFDPLQLLENPNQFATLLLLYGLILLPFTGLGVGQGALLAGYRRWSHRIYAMDLLGAGLGCLATLALLSRLSAAESLLAWSAASALAAGLLASGAEARYRAPAWILCGVIPLLLVLHWAKDRPFLPAHSKEIRAMYFDSDGERRQQPQIDHTVSSPTVRLDVSAPLQLQFGFGGTVGAPGRDRSTMRIVYQDGAAPTGLWDVEDPLRASYLALTSQGLAYQIRESPRVCVIGAGGGADVMIALHNGATSVTAVELNPQMMALGRDTYAELISGLYQREDVKPVVSEGRHFLARTQERFDIIQMSGVDTFAALASGAYAMSESYLYTVEAGAAVLQALEPDGLLTNSRWYLEPPRETLRLVSVMLEALHRDGAKDPAAHVLVMRAGLFATTLVSRRPFAQEELQALRRWVTQRRWSVILDPAGTGLEPFVKLAHGAQAERDEYLRYYPYDVSPVSDDGPFFFQFYRWRNLLRPPASRGGYSITRIPVGYAVLGASLLQMAILSALFIFGPLWSQRSYLRGQPKLLHRFVFFAAVGTGFMTIEITSIQTFTVFLGQPILSLAISLASLLVATGLGSAWAGRRRERPHRIVRRALLAATGWVACTVLSLGPILEIAIGWPLLARAILVAGWLMVVGFALGMPFPTAIRALDLETPALVPWAWGTNACFSVLASLASVLVAMEVGFRWTLVMALVFYWFGYLMWRGTTGGGNQEHPGRELAAEATSPQSV